MNDPVLIELIAVINEEVRTFHRLLTSLQEEQRVIIEDDLEGIEEIVAEQRQLAVYAHQIEARRIQLVNELALCLDLQPDNVSLSRLVEVLEGPHSEELANMRGQLLELNSQIRATSENNAFLIRQSLRYTDRCLDILTGQQVERRVYGQFGKAKRSAGERSLLNQTA
jgi:flagellar biosynthesis/type III secretory pathway chaperone|tara:strand:+ start:300 stop:803 length:504 start_codon:yes stop_codon:yes gene_type:complete